MTLARTASGRRVCGRPLVGLVSALSLMIVILAGCGTSGVVLEEDADLAAKLEQVVRDGRAVPLREVTGGDWDRVYILPGENTQDYVEEKVGGPVDMDGINEYGNEHGGIVVLKRGSEIQRAVSFEDFPFRSDFGTFGAQVVAERQSPGAQRLILREPRV